MAKLLVRRLVALVPMLLGLALILFILTRMLPADPVRIALGPDASPAQVAAYREQLGLDEPLWRQFVTYVSSLAQGDFGTSIMSRRPVINDLKVYFPATAELAVTSTIISAAISIPLGIISAMYRGNWIDRFSQVLSLFAVAMPVFWLGVILQILFYAELGWLPVAGRLGTDMIPPPSVTGMYTVDALIARDFSVFVDAVKHLILPAVALSNINIAILSRITRSSMLDVLGENYVMSARAKGLTERIVVMKHAFRNAIMPILTIGGMRFGDLMAGAVLTETIFGWPGIGKYAVYSITNLDFPALIGFALSVTLMYFVVNFFVDVLYTLLDPRIRL